MGRDGLIEPSLLALLINILSIMSDGRFRRIWTLYGYLSENFKSSALMSVMKTET